MRKLAEGAAGNGRGPRLAAMFLGLAPLAGLLAACGGAGGGPGGPEDSDLIVVKVTPTNGQETLANMSDPEVQGKLTMKFTGIPMASSMLDPTNAFNGVTPNVQILDQSFARVPGTPSVDKASRSFTFTPAGGQLPPAQYTVTVSKFVSSSGGKLLNNGIEDYSSSWTVGPDVYLPRVRNITPAQNQSEVPIFTPIVITFNESLDASTVVFGQTVFVEDGGVNPPVSINGTLSLQRDGFDMVFKPDPCVGMPPSTTIVVRLVGVGGGNVTWIKDRVGNGMAGDPNNANQIQFQFNTRGVKPLPIVANMWQPGSVNPPFPPPHLAYVSTLNRTYCFDLSAVTFEFIANRRVIPSLAQQVLAANRRPTQGAGGATWFYGPAYGGDYEAKLGRAGEAIIDYRFDPVTFDTYLYQIDEAEESVAIIHSSTGKTEGRFKGVGTPKGLAVHGSFSVPLLLVSNHGQGTVTAIPIGGIQAGQPICTAVQELNDDQSKRRLLEAGKNPAGVGSHYYGLRIAGVVNQGDAELQIFDPGTLGTITNSGALGKLTSTYTVGESPFDVGFSPYDPFNAWIFAFVVNQGGPTNPQGSVSLWWNSTGFTIFDSRSGTVVDTYEDGLDVPGRVMADPNNFRAFIPNTAGSTVSELRITTVGGFLYTTFDLTAYAHREVGANPTSITWAGNFDTALTTLAGDGQVAVYGLGDAIIEPALYNLPGCRFAFSLWNN